MSRSRATLLALALAAAGTAGLTATPATAAPSGASADKPARAEQALRAHPEQVALDDQDALAVRDVVTDADGTSHVRFDRTRAGLPVVGGDLVVHQKADGALEGVSATTRRPIRLSLTPQVTRDQAERAARAAARNGATSTDAGVLEVDSFDAAAPRLVWSVVVHGTQPDGTPSELATLVDARSGQVVDSVEQVETAADDSSLYSGTVDLSTTQNGTAYTLVDKLRGNGSQRTTNLNGATTGTGTLYSQATDTWGATDKAAVDVHYGAAATFDYYKNAFGRNGIRNDGVGALSRVHYGSAYNNAFWSDSCFCMTYGDGDGTSFTPLVELDVAGHEMSHGVMANTAALAYRRESGGLNEANSDIFGTMVEFSANNAKDVPDYFIGELIRPSGKPLRYMDKPSRDGGSADCWSKRVGSLDVHYSSGVGNHFFYLLSEGSGVKGVYDSPTCNGSTVTGIGNTTAAAIWYKAITTYMTSSTDYAGARVATLSAATSLYGAGSAQYNAVNAAWAAVSVV